MALKRQFDMSATFSMASMTDVIFLLLIFFMVTSTFVFPNALEVNLPESSSTTSLKPVARIFIDSEGNTATTYGDDQQPQMIKEPNQLAAFMRLVKEQETDTLAPTSFVALFADKEVPYGNVVEVLNLGAREGVRVVLSTSAPQSSPHNE